MAAILEIQRKIENFLRRVHEFLLEISDLFSHGTNQKSAELFEKISRLIARLEMWHNIELREFESLKTKLVTDKENLKIIDLLEHKESQLVEQLRIYLSRKAELEQWIRLGDEKAFEFIQRLEHAIEDWEALLKVLEGKEKELFNANLETSNVHKLLAKLEVLHIAFHHEYPDLCIRYTAEKMRILFNMNPSEAIKAANYYYSGLVENERGNNVGVREYFAKAYFVITKDARKANEIANAEALWFFAHDKRTWRDAKRYTAVQRALIQFNRLLFNLDADIANELANLYLQAVIAYDKAGYERSPHLTLSEPNKFAAIDKVIDYFSLLVRELRKKNKLLR